MIVSPAEIQRAVRASFVGDINALKPGNVSIYSDGHGMKIADFIRSAELCTPILCDPGLAFGERIFNAVEVTMTEVGCNTNLGMLLLFTPIIQAVAGRDVDGAHGLRQCLSKVLAGIDRADTEYVFRAIRTANPGGLGDSDRHDVAASPDCGLIQAMRAASGRDRIAAQYAHNFEDVIAVGLETIKYFINFWNSVEWATVGCYLTFMASFQDSHIRRKFGAQTAEHIRIKTAIIADRFRRAVKPEAMQRELMDYDRELKRDNINPGTSADLTAASLLVYGLIHNGNIIV